MLANKNGTKVFLGFLLLSIFLFFSPAETMASSFSISVNKKGEPIITLQEKPSADASFFQNKSNILRCLALSTPNTIYLAKTPTQSGGILIYSQEKDKKAIQNDLNQMIQIFYEPSSTKKNQFFAQAMTLKDYPKIFHQSSGNFILQNNAGNSEKKLLKPMDPTQYLTGNTKTTAAKSTVKKETPVITNVSLKDSFLTSYSLDLMTPESHEALQKVNPFWRNQLGSSLEKTLGKKIFEAIKSPNGEKIAFLAANTTETAQHWPSAIWNLYVVNNDGTDLVQLTNNAKVTEKISFYWSYNSNKIFFHQIDNLGNFNLFYANAENKQIHQITKGGSCEVSKLAYHNNKIAFLMRNDGRSDYSLWITDLNDNTSLLIAKNVSSALLSWSPDNSKLLFSKLSGEKNDLQTIKIGIANPNDASCTYLTEYSEYHLDGEVESSNVEWTPDSQSIVYVHAKNKIEKEIYCFNLTDNHKVLLASKQQIGHLQLSKEHVLFVERMPATNDYILWTTDYNGKNTKQVAKGNSTEVVYSTAGSKIAFCANDNLWFIHLGNQKLFKIFDPKKYQINTISTFKIRDLSWSMQGNKIYCILDGYTSSYYPQATPIIHISLSLNLDMK